MSNKQEIRRQEAAEASPASGKLLFWRVSAAVLLLAVIVLGVLLYFSRASLPAGPAETPPPAEETQDVSYSAWCYAPVGDPISVTAPAGEAVALPEGPQIDGYTFLCWADADGNEIPDGIVTLDADAAFSAVYAVAFRDLSAAGRHEPYLTIGSDRRFRPAGTVSRASAVELLYSILDTDLQGSVGFSDLDPSASCYTAAAALKELGAIDGSRFHPDDPISLSEFLEILAHFFPRSQNTYSFDLLPRTDARYAAFCLAMDRGWISDAALDPDRDLTRAEAAHIFNSLCGRSPLVEEDCGKVGTILDVSFNDPYFWDIAEAAISHAAEKTAGGETWTESDALSLYDEGLFFIGTELHCIDARGSAVVNESYGNFDFGPDGVITTGMPELDACVQETLKELVDPDTMTPEQMLYLLYNHVTYSNEYLRVHYYDVGDTSWVNDEAYHMFTVKKGNCYCYSAQFYVLARAIGFDPVIYSGTIEPDDSPHAWVEIEIDGEWYIYDTNLEYTQVHFNNYHGSFYKEPYWKAKGWHYFRGDEIEAEIAARG